MKKSDKKKNKKLNLFYKIISFLILIITVCTAGVVIYFEILPIMYLILFLLILTFICFIFIFLLTKKNLKLWVKNVVLVISLIFILALIFVNSYAMGTLDFLNNIIDTGYRSETYSLYTLPGSYNNVSDLNNKTIGLYNLNDDSGKKAIEKISSKISFNASTYEDLQELVNDLYEGKLDAILMSESYMGILIEQDSKYNDLESVFSFDILVKQEVIDANIDITKEPFIVYISGIDTNGKISAKSRSDVNILVAVNPNTGKILMLNTPRDYYVTLHSKGKKDKLTHAGMYGVEESLMTLEDLYDIDISYYVRVNFTSFITIVDKLGGISVDVPLSFCEQTSSRTSDAKICLKKGVQTLNGEQALALSRTRHTVSGGDRGRIANQLLVLNGIFDKAMSPSIIVKYNNLLTALGSYVTTNMDKDTIIDFVKDYIKDPINFEIEHLTVTGTDASNTCFSSGSANLYVMNIDEESVNNAKLALKTLLEG